MGEAAKPLLVEGFKTGCNAVLCGRCGISWRSNMFHDVSKVVLCGRRNTFASLSEDDLHFSWQEQHFGDLRCLFLRGRRSTLDVSCSLFLANRIVRAASSGDAQHSAINIPHFTLYTLHSTLYTLHCTIYTLHPTIYTPHFTPHTLHSTLYTPFLFSHKFDSGVCYHMCEHSGSWVSSCFRVYRIGRDPSCLTRRCSKEPTWAPTQNDQTIGIHHDFSLTSHPSDLFNRVTRGDDGLCATLVSCFQCHDWKQLLQTSNIIPQLHKSADRFCSFCEPPEQMDL